MSQVGKAIVPSYDSLVYGAEKGSVPRRCQSHVQLRFTLFKASTRHRSRLHPKAQGAWVLRAIINYRIMTLECECCGSNLNAGA